MTELLRHRSVRQGDWFLKHARTGECPFRLTGPTPGFDESNVKKGRSPRPGPPLGCSLAVAIYWLIHLNSSRVARQDRLIVPVATTSTKVTGDRPSCRSIEDFGATIETAVENLESSFSWSFRFPTSESGEQCPDGYDVWILRKHMTNTCLTTNAVTRSVCGGARTTTGPAGSSGPPSPSQRWRCFSSHCCGNRRPPPN